MWLPLQIFLRFYLTPAARPKSTTIRRRLSDHQGSRNAGDVTPVNTVDPSWVAAQAKPNVTFREIVSENSLGEF